VRFEARLARIELLMLAAKQRLAEPRQRVTLKIVYHDVSGHHPDECYTGPTYERVEGDDAWHLIQGG
jgi:hypothetical protein